MVLKVPLIEVEVNSPDPEIPQPLECRVMYHPSPETEALFDEWYQRYLNNPGQKCLSLLERDLDYEIVIETDHRGRPDYSRQQIKLKTKRAMIVAHYYGLIDDEKIKELIGE